jgi:hypothetical protein
VGQYVADQKDGEEQRRTKIFRKYRGVVNNSARNALPDDAWFYLENLQVIGDANVQVVPNISAALVDYTTHSIYWSQYVNVNGTDYLINFATDGTVWAWNISGLTNTQIGSGLSGSSSRLAQWKNLQVLIIDASGYYNWPGSGTITLITGAGVPSSGTDIAVAFGRVWILQSRLLTFSGANDYTATSFLVANGAGSAALTDPQIRNYVTRLIAQNGYLYLVAPTGINVISDVYVPSGASPPTPLFTNLNVQALIGSDEPGSICNVNQALVFANHMGIWNMNGTNAQKVSTDIDGTWKYVDFTQVISGGAFVSNNILCYGMLLKRLNDPIFGSNTVLACIGANDTKWFFANFGALTFVVSAIVNFTTLIANEPALFGFIGNKLYQLFANSSGPATVAMTPLWGMEDSLADKQVIRAGFEVTIASFSGTFGMTIDTTGNSQQAVTLNTSGNVVWQNNFSNIVQWQNNSLVNVSWFTGAYLLYNQSTPGVYGKYVGCTITASGSVYQLSAVDMDYKLRARWG